MVAMSDVEIESQLASLPLAPLAGPANGTPKEQAHPHGESTADLICRYLPDTTLTYVNDAYCERFGPRGQLIGRRFLDLLPDEIKGSALRHVESLVAHPRIETWEHEVRHPDGSKGWQEWLDFVIVDGDGTVVELQGIGRDATHRKRHEEALAAQYAVSRCLANDLALERVYPRILFTIASWLGFDFAALWIEDTSDHVLRCAGVSTLESPDAADLEAVTRRLSFAAGEMMPGRVWSQDQFTWRGNLARAHDFTRAGAAALSGLTSGLWHPIRSRRTTVGVLELLGRTAHKPDQATVRMLQAICLQIGQFVERNRAQEALRRDEGRLRALLRNATDGVMIVDQDGTIDYCSDSAGRDPRRTLRPISAAPTDSRSSTPTMSSPRAPISPTHSAVRGLTHPFTSGRGVWTVPGPSSSTAPPTSARMPVSAASSSTFATFQPSGQMNSRSANSPADCFGCRTTNAGGSLAISTTARRRTSWRFGSISNRFTGGSR